MRKNCKNISAKHKIVLSGTPLENSPDDLWSIFDFLQPGMLGSAAAFRKRYGSSAAETPELRHELACRISPFVLRRTKKEVAQDLPERTEKIVYCEFSDEQRALYETVLAEGRKDFAMNDEELEAFAKYHLATCEKRELLGASSHLLYICKKNS